MLINTRNAGTLGNVVKDGDIEFENSSFSMTYTGIYPCVLMTIILLVDHDLCEISIRRHVQYHGRHGAVV